MSALCWEGTGLSAIGFTALLATPWVLKFLWAPLIDRFGTLAARAECRDLSVDGGRRLARHRRVDHDIARAVDVLLSLLNLTAATQDIATDGLAVSRLALRARGLGQRRAGEIGMVVGGGVLLVLVMPPSAFPCATPRPSSVVRL